MSFAQDAEAFAAFLKIDKSVPRVFGRWMGGFMMMAHNHPFFEEPGVWAPESQSSMVARVYFTPWSQNKLHALKEFEGKAFFCALHRDVFLQSGRTRIPLFRRAWRTTDFSGARTRAQFEAGREGFKWLSAQLA